MANINLNNVHNRLENRLQLRRKADKDNATAWEIQSVLRLLKQAKYQHTSNNMVFNELQEQVDMIINQSLALMNSSRSGKKQLRSVNQLFRRQHNKKDKIASGADDIFEEELAAVIAVIESEATGQQTSISSHLAGQEVGNIAFNQIPNKVMDKYRDFLITRLNREVREKQDYTGVFARSGKTDVRGTFINFQGQLKPEWEYLFNLFKGRTFSVKNYSSWSQSQHIVLGATDYYKAIMGSLYALGYSQKYASQIFINAINAAKNGKEADYAQHFYHLQVGYELMGLGLGKHNKNGEFEEMKTVDFFIYNDPATDAIVVKSTAQMLLDLIQNTKNHNKYISQINVSKTYFQQLGVVHYKK